LSQTEVARRFEIDPKSPFTFLVERPEGRSILLQGGLLYLLFFLIVPIFMIAGYPVALARALVRGTPIPSVWNFSHALDGLKLGGVFLAYAAPFFLTFVLPFVASTVSDNGAMNALSGGTFFGVMALGQVYILAITALQPSFIAVLASSGKMSDCFRFHILKQVIGSFGWSYLAAFGLIYAAGIIGMIGIVACIIGVFWTMFYVSTVQGHIGAQLAQALTATSSTDAGALGHT